jgi:hypothetical protein
MSPLQWRQDVIVGWVRFKLMGKVSMYKCISETHRMLVSLPFQGRVRVGMGFLPSRETVQDSTHPRPVAPSLRSPLEGGGCTFI